MRGHHILSVALLVKVRGLACRFIPFLHLSVVMMILATPHHPESHSRAGARQWHQNFSKSHARDSVYEAFGFPPIPSGFAGESSAAPTIFTQLSVAAVTYFGLVSVLDRPRGELSVDPNSIHVKESQVDGAGLGLYASRPMPEGTVLGTYPGVVIQLERNLCKLRDHPECESYTWRFTDNTMVIDPTDSSGALGEMCYGGTADTPFSQFFMEKILKSGVPTMLARINEPPLGSTCSVSSEEDLEKREIIFSLSRDVVAGEELFMDYGLTYDRSNYARPN